MAEESSFDGFRGEYASPFASSTPPPPPVPASNSRFELRPLTTGEILDRTFYLYRGNFWLFASISAFVALSSTLMSIGVLIFPHFVHTGPALATSSPTQIATTIVLGLLAGGVYLLAYSVVHAAMVSAVIGIYLGDTTTMAASFAAVKGQWLRYVGIALWQFWSYMWVFIATFIPFAIVAALLAAMGATGGAGGAAGAAVVGILMLVSAAGAFVLGAISYIRNSLAVPVEVMEKVKVRAAMKRSKFLAGGSKGRIFMLGLLMFALYIVASAAQAPIAFLILKAGPGKAVMLQVLNLFIGFVVATVITPVGGIGLCLFYFDQRVRKEGFDIEFMLLRSGPVPVVEPAPFAIPTEAALEPASVDLTSETP